MDLPIQLQKYLTDSGISEQEFTSQERIVLNKILSELERTGSSKLLQSLYDIDYEEIPVSFDRFISDPDYLGGSTDNGASIWPAWKRECEYLFNPLNKIYMAFFRGPIGVGKSTIASYGVNYIIYKLLCLKDPSRFYNISPDSRIGIALFNITLTKGYGVGFAKINGALKKSPWFRRHGEVVGTSERTSIFIPDKDITIGVGSMAEHFIGQDVFCLVPETKILTDKGTLTLKQLNELNDVFKVASLSKKGTIRYSTWTCCHATKLEKILYHIELEDGYVIKGSGSHKLLDYETNKYKALKKTVPGDCVYGLDGPVKITRVWVETLSTPIQLYDIIDAKPYNNFIIDTGENYVVSHNCLFLDEADFKDTKETDLTKMKVYDTWTAMFRRMESRFMDRGQIPGMAFLVSSAKHQDSFMAQMSELYTGKSGVYILEKPFWEMVRPERYCGKKFKLILSTKTEDAFILEDESTLSQYENSDYEIYDVPIEHYDAFQMDIQGAMRDILGRASKVSTRFLYEPKIEEAMDDRFHNCFTSNRISLGTLQDGKSLLDYLDISKIDKKLIRYPLFIHHDLSLGSSDDAGFYITAVANDTNESSIQNTEELAWKFLPVGWCKIRAEKKGAQIPLFKIREGVKELRDRYGFNILAVSADGYQSADMLQQYRLANFDTFLLSMDRPPSDGYMFFRSSLYGKKIILPKDDQLKKELTELIENTAQGKVDHPTGGQKDLSDACAGSIYCAVKYNNSKKVPLFSDGGYLLTDLITGTKDSAPTKADVNRDIDNAMLEMQQGLFSGIPGVDDDPFPML